MHKTFNLVVDKLQQQKDTPASSLVSQEQESVEWAQAHPNWSGPASYRFYLVWILYLNLENA